MTNSRPAFRKNDNGIHAACCNTNTWEAVQGSATVFINNKEAVRLGDRTKHCGGSGTMIEGSNNVIIGGAAGGGGGGGSGGGSASGQTGGQAQGGAGSQTGTNTNQTGRGSGAAGAGTSPSASPPGEGDETEDKPEPILVSATWSKSRVPVSTEVKLQATCGEMAGKPAKFTIKDADDESKMIASVNGTCDASKVEATWKTPVAGPPGRFVFTVEADGKEASSGVLVLINEVSVTLMLDEEPAANVRVKLRVEPGGEILSGEANEKGVVTFEEAPFGSYTLLLDDEAAE